MTYLATSINESAVIIEKAGVTFEDVRGKAVKFDEDGKIIPAGASEAILGVGIMTNDTNINKGEDVHIQIKDIGLVKTGAAIAKGAELSTDANGCFIPAKSGMVTAIALDTVPAAGVYVKARMVAYKKATVIVGINSADYETLEAAIEAAEDFLTISKDTTVNEPLKIAEGKTITLVVPAGVTLSLDAGASNYGLVVKGNATLENDGEIVLTGYGFGTSIGTDSKLTIKNGRFVANNCDYIFGCFDGEIVIEGGEFTGEYCVINNFSETYNTDGKVIIKGGTFNTAADGFDMLGNYIEVSGGRFSKPVNESYCAAGYKPTTEPDKDGYYTVTKID